MKVLTYIGSRFAANSHLVIDEDAREAVLFDASCPCAKINDRLADGGITLRYIVLTHGHYDHMLTLSELRQNGTPLCIGAGDAENLNDAKKSCAFIFGVNNINNAPAQRLLADGDFLSLGDGGFRVMATPGHSPGSCCFLFDDFLITGDTLFAGDNGRYDLPGGDYAALCASLHRLAGMPGNLKIYPGHGGTSTIMAECERNPYMA